MELTKKTLILALVFHDSSFSSFSLVWVIFCGGLIPDPLSPSLVDYSVWSHLQYHIQHIVLARF